jgi:F0F1-type ATP synthase assembly protein I
MAQPPQDPNRKEKQKKLLRKSQKQLKNYARYSGLAIEMGVIIAAGAIGGLKLDQKFDLAPLFTLILTILALVMAIYIAIKDVLNMNK